MVDYAAVARAMSPQPAPEPARVLLTRHFEHTDTETRTIIREREIGAPPILAPAPAVTPAGLSGPVRHPATPTLHLSAATAPQPFEQPEAAAPPIAPVPRHRAPQEEPRLIRLPKAVSSGLPSAARPQPSARRPSTTVEVVLDGAAIGRWVDQHLARAVTRPPSGVTGFDPRLSPVWTTAPVAN